MKRAIFIGQVMPRVKRHLHDWPSLNGWLYSIGVTDEQTRENFMYSSLIDYFPGSNGGSHLLTTGEWIEKERERLVKTISQSLGSDLD